MSIGTKIILEGEKEYKKAISDVNSSMRVLKSELKAVSAEFDGNANSVDALNKKNEVLNKQQKEQEKAIKLLRGALESATKEFGENSKQAQNWQIKLNNAQAQLSKLNKEIDNNDKHLKEAKSSTDKTAKSIDEFGKEVKEAQGETKIFGDVLKANLASDAIFEGVKKLGSLMVDMIKDSKDLASDLLEVQNVVDVTFGEGSADIDKWAETIGEAFGLSELRGKQFVGTMGAMLKAAELTDDEILGMSKSLAELASDMSSFFNIDVDSMFDKLLSGISGSSTKPLQQLGYDLRVANLEASALAQGIETAYSEMSQKEQTILRYNYLMKVSADAQGDFARNIDSQANQERIMQLQREELLKRFGDAILPAVTRATMKFNEATKDMGGDLAKVAGVLADDVVDVLVWIIDNADTVIAGLKGIGAAIVAKKAADGVLFVVKAYQTLTTTTQAATTAQVAFNTATKANIYVAIASAIIGVATALFSYAKNAREAAEETRKLNDEAEQLTQKSKETSESIQKNIQDRIKAIDTIEAETNATKSLIDSLYELASEETKTNSSKEKMLALVEQINKAVPDLNLSIDEQTGLLNKQREEVEKLLAKRIELSTVEALQGQLSTIALDRYNQEQALNDLLDARAIKERELVSLQEEIAKNKGYNAWDSSDGKIRWLVDAEKDIENVKSALEANEILVEEAKVKLNDLTSSYQKALDYIGDHSVIDTSAKALIEFGDKFSKALEAQTQAEIGTLEDRQKKISKIYDETSKELDKQLRAEERAFAKSQQKRVEEVQKAQEKELSEVEKVHKAKLELLNEEYLEKIKTVDEDRYKELKKVQDEIDAIDNQQEAEDRALKAREDAEKKAELQARVESAKTIEERMDAQKELQKHEERVAKERLKEERGLQKDILKQQKETINDGFDEKVKAIEAEQKKEQEKLADQLKNEKDAVSERYNLKLEVLKEEQELEKDALRERQAEYKDYLREQRELAIANSTTIYEEDLAKFKMNQALKEGEITSVEAQMKSAIQKYAYFSMQPGIDRDTVLKSTDLEEMLKYYNPSGAIKTSVPQSTVLDYSLLEEIVTRGMKKADIKIYLDRKLVGNFVEDKVNGMIRR